MLAAHPLALGAILMFFFWKNSKLYPVHPIYSTHPNHQPNFSTFSLKEPLNVMPQKSYLSLGNYVFSDLSHLNIRPMTSFRLVITTQTRQAQGLVLGTKNIYLLLLCTVNQQASSGPDVEINVYVPG